MDLETKSFGLTTELLDSFYDEISSETSTRIATNACLNTDPIKICVNRSHLNEASHVFTHKVPGEAKPITNQQSSGRCWIFAGLNTIRLPFMKSLNIDEFEFSQVHLFFWDKIERCNYFLNKMIELAKAGEEVEGRLLSFLLHDPVNDGGQWNMLVNLVIRYGLIPKKCCPESFSSTSTFRMNKILKSKLREYTQILRSAVEEKLGDKKIHDILEGQMKEIYRIVVICLGFPPKTFIWEYYDGSKEYHKIGPITPLDFYNQHIKPIYDIEQKVCLVNDPRTSNPYGCTYTVSCLGNVIDGQPTVYNNQSIDLLMMLAAQSIKEGEAVWFGCDVNKRVSTVKGIQDLDIHDYKSVFGVDVSLGLSKADRLIYGESLMTHAMTLTAVTIDPSNQPVKWQVENSWGDSHGENGYLVLTSDWFKEFVYEVAIDKRFVPKEVMDVFNKKPIVLPAWDPMGALATCEVYRKEGEGTEDGNNKCTFQ